MNALLDMEEFKCYNDATLGPLLQHYGIRTPHLDLVDNVWVALWFASHHAKREENKTEDVCEYRYSKNTEEYSYIFLIFSDTDSRAKSENGVYNGGRTTLVDLRKATPSFFLRPHAQHAYMLKKNNPANSINSVDCSDLLVGIAEIPTISVLEWLGKNKFLTVDSLFPAKEIDTSYAKLLEEYPVVDSSLMKDYGSIQIITERPLD